MTLLETTVSAYRLKSNKYAKTAPGIITVQALTTMHYLQSRPRPSCHSSFTCSRTSRSWEKG
jgi:hypothetical protein